MWYGWVHATGDPKTQISTQIVQPGVGCVFCGSHLLHDAIWGIAVYREVVVIAYKGRGGVAAL